MWCWIQLCNLSFYHRTWHLVGPQCGLLRKEEMPLQGPGPNQGVLGKGQGLGQALLAAFLEERAKPAATPQGTLLPGTGKSVASLAWPWVLPGGGGGVALRPLCAKPESLDEEVSSLRGRAHLALDWWLQEPMNTSHSRESSCPEPDGP